MLHKQILSPKQIELLDFVHQFKQDHILVGGTAVALQVGHRRSIDFDLFTQHEFESQKILNLVKRKGLLDRLMIASKNELTLLAHQVKMTWYYFPYKLVGAVETDFAFLPNLTTLGAMKLYALNGRAKWKDYVDLYVLFKHEGLRLADLINQAKKLFGSAFSEKLIRVQLSYYKDVSFAEEVEWMPGWYTDQANIKKYLTDVSLE